MSANIILSKISIGKVDERKSLLTFPVRIILLVLFYMGSENLYAQNPCPSFFTTEECESYALIWSDEFDSGLKPNPVHWSYEAGFVRNNELQYYQQDNASLQNGFLIIEGRREKVANHKYDANSEDWRRKSEFSAYTSSSINTRGKMEFQYGILVVKAKIDTALGMWPAIWTLGVTRPWPANGEVDIMEYYRRNDKAYILANAAWKGTLPNVIWDEAKIELEELLKKNRNWPNEFHIWTMDWNEDRILLYLDGELLNEIDLAKTSNPDGFNPFHHPHYVLLNLAIGSNGGDPSNTDFPRTYQVDYVRVFQKTKTEK